MGIHRFKPSPRQEFIGRAALVVLGLLLGFVGYWIGWFCIKLLFGFAEAGADRPLQMVSPLAILSGFLMLLAATLIAMAFLPTKDTSWGPPRGFAAVSRAFDWFWEIVVRVFK